VVYPRLVTGLGFVASILHSLAWPTAVVLMAVLLRRELSGAFRRIESLEFPGGKATFARLGTYEPVIAIAAKAEGPPANQAVVQEQQTEFGALEAMAMEAPAQAIIGAWALLEYQLNVASDRLAPEQQHGWPQVAHNLEKWNKWPLFFPAVVELRRLRDYTVSASRSPSASDAALYVSVARSVATALQAPSISQPSGVPASTE